NVPVAASALIGRSTARQHLQDVLSAYRVVNLTRPSGIGKSALGLEVARSLFPTFEGDCWLVEFASLSDSGPGRARGRRADHVEILAMHCSLTGTNPLTLLHAALSDGVDNKSDEECLDDAHVARLVFAELAERLGQLLKEEKELQTAIGQLLKRPSRSA